MTSNGDDFWTVVLTPIDVTDYSDVNDDTKMPVYYQRGNYTVLLKKQNHTGIIKKHPDFDCTEAEIRNLLTYTKTFIVKINTIRYGCLFLETSPYLKVMIVPEQLYFDSIRTAQSVDETLVDVIVMNLL